jgi:hypothetical protein
MCFDSYSIKYDELGSECYSRNAEQEGRFTCEGGRKQSDLSGYTDGSR